MNQNLRRITPAVYAAAILVGFLINPTVGIAVIIVGGILSSLVYTMTRGGAAGGATPRRAPRQRNRR